MRFAPRRLALLALLVAAGCPRPPAAAVGPESALQAYLNAVAAGRLDEAYNWMSADYRKTHDRAAFERALGDRRGAEKLRGARVELEAEAQLPDGERLPLVMENGAWRLARDPLDFYPQRTPAEALRSFLRAVENRRYEVVVRFVPSRYRATVTVDAVRARWEGERRAELGQQLDAIRAALARGEPLELGPPEGEARLQLGERKQAKLVREDGDWKIESLE
ncbi:MAG TPA: hypothetical protein VFF06_16620 [Polyangia bacterium]|nr:hypothetical protein [Polyangia bacterium]